MRVFIAALTLISGMSAIFIPGGAWAQSAGLPQLEISTFPPQLIWLTITFVVLYFMMSRVALPRLSQILEERQRKIDDNLKKAEVLKEEAEAAAQGYQKALADARAQAHGVMLETHERIAADAAKAQADAGARLEAEIKAAEARIGEARDSAMAGLSEVATEVALNAAQKVSGESLSEKDVARVVNTVMEDRQ